MDPSPTEEPAVASPVVPRQRSELTPLVPSTPPAEVVRRTASGSPWPMRLAILVGVVALLCVGGLGVAFHLYDKATKPDRSTPAIAVQNYLQAYLVERSDSDTSQFICSDPAGLASVRTFRSSVDAKQKQIGAVISISWEEPSGLLSSVRGRATIPVVIVESANVDGVSQVVRHQWVFTIVQSNGWRVCGATEAE